MEQFSNWTNLNLNKFKIEQFWNWTILNMNNFRNLNKILKSEKISNPETVICNKT
jgi:hypothetical protein